MFIRSKLLGSNAALSSCYASNQRLALKTCCFTQTTNEPDHSPLTFPGQSWVRGLSIHRYVLIGHADEKIVADNIPAFKIARAPLVLHTAPGQLSWNKSSGKREKRKNDKHGNRGRRYVEQLQCDETKGETQESGVAGESTVARRTLLRVSSQIVGVK